MRVILALLATSAAAIFVAAPANAEEPNPRALALQKPAAWGTVLGRVVFDGDDPPLRVVPMLGPQPRVAPPPGNPAGVPLPVLIVEDSLIIGENRGLANAFAYLRSKPSRVHPAEAQAPPRKYSFEANNLRFEPHALIMTRRDKLALGNRTNEPLNIHYQGSDPFNLLLKADETKEWQIKQTENVPQTVRSNIKQWMSGCILVRDDSYGSVTNERGLFVIANLPLNEPLELQLWHERAGYLRNITSTTAHKTSPVGQLRITLTDAVTDLGEFRVPPELFKE